MIKYNDQKNDNDDGIIMIMVIIMVDTIVIL